MKKIFTIFIVILTSISSLQAQELAVQSFVLAETDLTANTPGTMVEDQNGNVCALIKVETTVEGFSFDVGSLGVSQVKREGGEIWVYVPFGVRRITLSHPQLGVIRDYPFPCPIEKGRTYIMKLVTGTVKTVVEYAQTKQFLQIQLNPADAFLEINGKMKVTENGLYQELLPFGKYQYKAYYPEYHGTIENLKYELTKVHNITGKNVMIAETAWSYSYNDNKAYETSVQGQADEIRACVNAMVELGEYAVGVFYWEPAWIDVPGDNEESKIKVREKYGAGWASSYAGSYDPYDAGKYYGASDCIDTSLFDTKGHPLESLKTFLYVRYGTKE
jgi:hypothetical protein